MNFLGIFLKPKQIEWRDNQVYIQIVVLIKDIYINVRKFKKQFTKYIIVLFRSRKLQSRCYSFVCLFVWGFSTHSRDFTHMETHHYRWRAANSDICLALMAIEQWGFFSVSRLLWHGAFVTMVISEDPRHSHVLPSDSQWSCHNLFLRLRSLGAGIRTPNLPLAGRLF